MALISSISGIRGTIGGEAGKGFTPPDIFRYTLAYVRLLRELHPDEMIRIVVGRDGRSSGIAINRMVCGLLQLSGAEVVNLGMSTTPSVELSVTWHKAHGGIIISASHNGAAWNALKLLNSRGEFISSEQGEKLLEIAEDSSYEYPNYNNIGGLTSDYQSIERHVEAILQNPLVNTDAIRQAGFRVVFDGINSTGGIALPLLLEELGVSEIIPLNEKPDGRFAHDPEPLPANLTEIIETVKKNKADVGFVVDPDVDRLAIICEDGTCFGEEYTLVAVADYVLSVSPGDTVSNLSSTRALKDVTFRYGKTHHASAVGEVNVVEMMKKVNAVIGGEGNGGIILPSLHYGRDALAGIALFLSYIALKEVLCSELRRSYPEYFISKNKIALSEKLDIGKLFDHVAANFDPSCLSSIDGLKIDLPEGWIHLRKSNTEPIIRIYSEAQDENTANSLAEKIIKIISSYAQV